MFFYHRSLVFEVPENVYYPREDSLLLAKTIETMDLEDKKVLEVGCGSGFLSVLMAKNGARVTAVDINKNAVEATMKNASKNNVKIGCYISDIFSTVRGKYDIIVFNPPYLPEGDESSQKDIKNQWNGGPTGREVAVRFIENIENFLNKDGTVLMVISSLTDEKKVVNTFKKNRFRVSSITREKISWEELIVIRAEKI